MTNALKHIAVLLIIPFLLIPVFGGSVVTLTINGAIDPPVARYIDYGIDEAHKSGAEIIVILLDTPGGLMSSTESIVDKILHSDIPISVFIYPTGAKAASAGVFISMSSHIAAMAPGTHLGAAHPVSIGVGTGSDTSAVMMNKVTNDAVAWLKSLAQLRGRNEDWAEQAVRHSESIIATEAESMNVIDLIIDDINALLDTLHGDTVIIDNDTLELSLVNAVIEKINMTIPQKFLHIILNPNIAYLLMMLGILGIYFEFQNPGAIFPGVIGVLSILSAAYAFQILPVNYIGIIFLLAGVAMFILEFNIPGFGLLTTGGVIAMLLGSFMLTSGSPPEFAINWWTIIPTVAFVAFFFIFVVAKALMIQRKKSATGLEGLVGEIGEVSVDIPDRGYGKIMVHGEIWNAEANEFIARGTDVKVIKANGMTLFVEKAE